MFFIQLKLVARAKRQKLNDLIALCRICTGFSPQDWTPEAHNKVQCSLVMTFLVWNLLLCLKIVYVFLPHKHMPNIYWNLACFGYLGTGYVLFVFFVFFWWYFNVFNPILIDYFVYGNSARTVSISLAARQGRWVWRVMLSHVLRNLCLQQVNLASLGCILALACTGHIHVGSCWNGVSWMA